MTIGRVHCETLAQGRGAHHFDVVNLSSITTVQALIKFRREYDTMYETKAYESSNGLISNGVPTFHEIIEVLYLDLERLIKKAKLNDSQSWMVVKYMQGYKDEDIADALRIDVRHVYKLFYSACKKIVEENNKEWNDFIETSGLVRTKDNYKQCSKCKEWKKANIEEFSPDKSKKDGFKYICKQCDKLSKRRK
jgi:hypothetical protein